MWYSLISLLISFLIIGTADGKPGYRLDGTYGNLKENEWNLLQNYYKLNTLTHYGTDDGMNDFNFLL